MVVLCPGDALRGGLRRIATVRVMAGIPAQSFGRVKRTPILILLLLLATCFSLATLLQPQALAYGQRGQDNVLQVFLGNGRWLLANHFVTKADVYFHSGYYPTIFDRKPAQEEK